MPPTAAPHIIDRLLEIGLSEAAGMGVVPISWTTISAWQQVSAVELDPWEARLIHRLSMAYVAEGHRAESETCPSPWRAPVTREEANAEEANLRAALG